MKAIDISKKIIRAVNSIVNYFLLAIIVLLVSIAGYALWDSSQIYEAADSTNYTIYKPTVIDEGLSFQELQEINPDVFAWLTVYGTKIDYPVVQGVDNSQYINKNPLGEYSLSGSIFLDYKNNLSFTDFNSILFGHHMAQDMMFGSLDSFVSKAVFDSHRYGNLYFEGRDHGIEFFAFLETDAYDSEMFAVGITGQSKRMAYLAEIHQKAVFYRDIGVTADDHIILLSTCSATSTNGRDLLVGVITDEVYPDNFTGNETEEEKTTIQLDNIKSFWDKLSINERTIVLSILGIIIIALLILVIKKYRTLSSFKKQK